jgi:hypothetical protein
VLEVLIWVRRLHWLLSWRLLALIALEAGRKLADLLRCL